MTVPPNPRASASGALWVSCCVAHLALVAIACDGDVEHVPAAWSAGQAQEVAAAPDAPTYHQTIKPIVDAKCTGCHVEGGIAPFPLTSYEALRARAAGVRAAVSNRSMPPWHADPSVRRYRYDPSLSATQLDAIVRWIDDGLVAGDASRPAAPLPRDTSELANADLTLSLAEPYAPRQSNEYRCFVLDWPYEKPMFVTGFDARPSNPGIVHHIQAYLAAPADVATVRRFDDAEAGPGYTCFGAPSPPGAPVLSSRFLGGWTPGRGAMKLPEGTGVEVAAGSKVLLQVHYHLDAAHGAHEEADRSSLLMTVAERVRTPGLYVPWMDERWALDPRSMLIPSGSPGTTHGYRAKPANSLVFFVFSGNARFPNGFTVHSVYPHAHKLARRISTSVVHAGGAVEPLVEVPRWDFDWQREYVLAEPTRVGPNDELALTCTYRNTAADQPWHNGAQLPPRDVTWGEGTEDEMCSMTLYITPN